MTFAARGLIVSCIASLLLGSCVPMVAADPADPGEVKVVLAWNTDADLDLEIWSEDGKYLGDACRFMNSPNVTSGLDGEEWFVFRRTKAFDFSRGRWIVSAFFHDVGPSGSATATAILTLHMAGRTERLTRELGSAPGHNQWMAFIVDMDAGTWEPLDHFLTMPGNQPPGPYEMWAELAWDTDADLDLEIWSHELEFVGSSADLGFPEVVDGLTGSEWVVFRPAEEGPDLGRGKWAVSVYFYDIGPSGRDVARATVTVHLGGETESLTRMMHHDAPYDQWMAYMVDVDAGTCEVLDYFLDPGDEIIAGRDPGVVAHLPWVPERGHPSVDGDAIKDPAGQR